jgi:hypothetical protein
VLPLSVSVWLLLWSAEALLPLLSCGLKGGSDEVGFPCSEDACRVASGVSMFNTTAVCMADA